ncbi:hypothetical protein ACFQY8_00295 [Alloscardovia venturai]|uniref:Uncharacterized protein n=1 Tax=Alloscardovia venturai TaxID=1769421 RepID=A0ABW2Y1R2_9BIFI
MDDVNYDKTYAYIDRSPSPSQAGTSVDVVGLLGKAWDGLTGATQAVKKEFVKSMVRNFNVQSAQVTLANEKMEYELAVQTQAQLASETLTKLESDARDAIFGTFSTAAQDKAKEIRKEYDKLRDSAQAQAHTALIIVE